MTARSCRRRRARLREREPGEDPAEATAKPHAEPSSTPGGSDADRLLAVQATRGNAVLQRVVEQQPEAAAAAPPQRASGVRVQVVPPLRRGASGTEVGAEQHSLLTRAPGGFTAEVLQTLDDAVNEATAIVTADPEGELAAHGGPALVAAASASVAPALDELLRRLDDLEAQLEPFADDVLEAMSLRASGEHATIAQSLQAVGQVTEQALGGEQEQ